MRSIALLLLLAATIGGAQSKTSAAPLSPTIGRVVEVAAGIAELHYVFPDTGRMIAEHLRKRLREGAFDSVKELAQLADRLTLEMRAVNGDRHLYATFAGTGGAQSTPQQPTMVRRRPGDAPDAAVITAARRSNYDFNSVQRLPGNVGYLSVGRLSSRGIEESYAAVDAAMAFLAHVDAMIIDLRQTVGGDPRMSDYLASYFFGADPVPTLTSYSRRSDRTEARTTVPVKGTRRSDIPLFILVGQGTASGTEDFAFTIKQSGRGTLIGGRTAGAGRLNAIFPVGDGFSASVSVGRTFDPRTGQEWERTGIEPQIATTQDEALTVAHAAALERLASATKDAEWKHALVATRTALLSRTKPVLVREALLKTYAGEYDLRAVDFENGKLWYRRDATRPREELTPIDSVSFALGEATRVEFVVEGTRITAMNLISPLGQKSTYPRTSASGVVGAVNGGSVVQRVELRHEVEALLASMVAAFKRDPASVARFYAYDAAILGGGGRHVGREQVDAYWRGATMFSDWKLEIIDVGGDGPTPWVRGRSTIVGRSGMSMVTEFIGLLRRQPDNSLRFQLDMFVAASPMARRTSP